jgi:hypothetical protein
MISMLSERFEEPVVTEDEEVGSMLGTLFD